MSRCAICVLLAVAPLLPAQDMEEWVESSTDPQELHAEWDDLCRNPLDLNHVSERELGALPFFDRAAARSVVQARDRRGGFLTSDEARAVAGLTLVQRDVLNLLTTVGEPRELRSDVSILAGVERSDKSERLADEWASRVRAIFRGRDRRAFVLGTHESGNPEVLARASAGVEFVKNDAGARLLAGDYQCESGTGLVFASPFGAGHWLASTEAVGPGAARGLALKPSGNRRLVFRGVSAEVARGPVSVSVLGSWMRRDAALTDSGVLRLTEGETPSSAELRQAREGQVEERLAGATVAADAGIVSVGITGYAARFDPPLVADMSIVLPAMEGAKLNAGSVFVSAAKSGASVVSEVARSDPGGGAVQTAFSFCTGAAGIAVYHVRADEDFFSPHSVAWDEFGAAAQNVETRGVRIHAVTGKHTLFAAVSASRTPFRTSRSPLRKSASLIEMRWRMALTSQTDLRWRLSRSWNEDGTASGPWQDIVTDAGRVELRLARDTDEYRMRIELRSAKRQFSADRKLGSLLFVQSIQRWRGLEIGGRLTFHHLESADVAMQVYELPLRGEYPLVVFTGSGQRVTLVAARRWSGVRVAVKLVHARQDGGDGVRDDTALGCELTYHY